MLVGVVAAQHTEDSDMPVEENKTLIRKIAELINSRDLDAACSAFSSDFVDHAPGSRMVVGIQGARQLFQFQFAAFPDMQTSFEDIVGEDDKVVRRMTVRGTNTGTFLGMPPTGQSVTWSFIDIFRIAEGKIAEHWVEMDLVVLLRQLGLVPPPVGRGPE